MNQPTCQPPTLARGSNAAKPGRDRPPGDNAAVKATRSLPAWIVALVRVARVLAATALALLAMDGRAAVVFTTLHTFQRLFTNGSSPNALVLGNDGNFYGTTANGGASGNGTVFRISPDGALTSLYSFTGNNTGGSVYGVVQPDGLVQGSDGYFYGTTMGGGTKGYGTVFRINANGTLTNLYSFPGGYAGGSPYGGLVQGNDGNFYGTTLGGPVGSYGNVFKISTNGTLTTLHSFTGGYDGGIPYGGLVQVSDGNFYGTTYIGGIGHDYSGEGTVFRISTNGVLTTLHAFSGADDGANPGGGLVQASDGNLYGTTAYGGSAMGQAGSGTVFRIGTNGVLTTLYSFTGGSDGAFPWAALVQGSDGNFYGTTKSGGSDFRDIGSGTIFEISADGALTTLYSFTGASDGSHPVAKLTQGSDGNFYGMTGFSLYANSPGGGTVFKITAAGVFTNLYSFPIGPNDGANPHGALVQGSDHNLYGTTADGGTGFGTVFKISTNGALTSLYSFTGGADGANPHGALVQGSDGNFYGTTYSGGAIVQFGSRGDTVFRISAAGALTTLYAFTGGSDGGLPNGGLVQGNDGNFYGTTLAGGIGLGGDGTVFRINAAGALTTLYAFTETGETDGANPYAGLVQGSDGNFYGTTGAGGAHGVGTVFQISPDGTLTTLHSFTGGNDGGGPQGGLVQGSDGNFYGTTASGGTHGLGTVFKMNATGLLTTLHSFAGSEGANPWAALVQGSDGNFYGTTYAGGSYTNGTVFELSTNGVLTSLYSFTGGNDGANPTDALVQGNDGNFYGTTAYDGAFGNGTVFRIEIASRPTLTSALNGNQLILSWPTNAAGFTLQTSPDLTNWSDSALSPVTIDAQNNVTDTVSASAQFYRLKK